MTVSNPNSSTVPTDTYSFETPEELNGDWVLKPSTNVKVYGVLILEIILHGFGKKMLVR